MQRYIGILWVVCMLVILVMGVITGQWYGALAIGITGVSGYVLALWRSAPLPRLFGRRNIPHLWSEVLGWRLDSAREHAKTWDDWTPHLELIRLVKLLRSSVADGMSPMFVMQVAADIAVISLLTAARHGARHKEPS